MKTILLHFSFFIFLAILQGCSPIYFLVRPTQPAQVGCSFANQSTTPTLSWAPEEGVVEEGDFFELAIWKIEDSHSSGKSTLYTTGSISRTTQTTTFSVESEPFLFVSEIYGNSYTIPPERALPINTRFFWSVRRAHRKGNDIYSSKWSYFTHIPFMSGTECKDSPFRFQTK